LWKLGENKTKNQGNESKKETTSEVGGEGKMGRSIRK
jgi:hypothetical protein